jgi:hypothetical protein
MKREATGKFAAPGAANWLIQVGAVNCVVNSCSGDFEGINSFQMVK